MLPCAHSALNQAAVCHGPYPMFAMSVPAFSEGFNPARATAIDKSLFHLWKSSCSRAPVQPKTQGLWREYELPSCHLRLLMVRAIRETLHDEVRWDGWHRLWELPTEASIEQIHFFQPMHILEKLQAHVGEHLDVPVNAKYMLVARLSRQRFEELRVKPASCALFKILVKMNLKNFIR